MSITATLLVDDERPAMDREEQLHTEDALSEAVRSALFDAFLSYEPVESNPQVQNVTVTFSGHVTE